MRCILLVRNSCRGDDTIGDEDGDWMGIPRYSGTITGDEGSIAEYRSRMVFRSSEIDSLHSWIAASKRWISTHVSLCFSKYHWGIWPSHIRHRMRSVLKGSLKGNGVTGTEGRRPLM